ncbi:MAG TPA: NADH-quinone oxidoreductase subunit L, partial [Verrucomicrobiae bacterium]
MNSENIAWAILLMPLLAAVIIALFTQRDGKFSAQLSIAAIVIAFLVSLIIFFTIEAHEISIPWLSVGALR